MDNGDGSSTKRAAAGAGTGRALTYARGGFVGVGAAAALYVMGLAACKPPEAGGLQALSRGGMAKLKVLEQGVGPGAFEGPDGRQLDLSAFKGRVVVLNLWATWCAPCVKEMPTLAALQSDFSGRGVSVVALSADSEAQKDKARDFIRTHPPLRFYYDAHLGAVTKVVPQVQGFPTTLLFDRSGRLRAEVQGDADWSSPEAKSLVEALLKS